MALTGMQDLLKFRDLKRRVKLSSPHVLGILETVWMYSHNHATDRRGILLSPQELEALAEWDGEDGALCDAMVATKWLDRDGELVHPHDYWDHCPEFAKRRIGREESRKSPSVTGENAKMPVSDGKKSAETRKIPSMAHSPNRTEPNRTEPNQTKPDTPKNADPENPGDRARAEHGPCQDRRSASADAHASHFRQTAGGTAGQQRSPVAQSTAQVLAGLHLDGGNRDAHRWRFTARAVSVTREGPDYWATVVKTMDEFSGLEYLDELLRTLETAADPVQRKAKDIGEFRHPAAWLTKQCHLYLTEHGGRMPRPPQQSRAQ